MHYSSMLLTNNSRDWREPSPLIYASFLLMFLLLLGLRTTFLLAVLNFKLGALVFFATYLLTGMLTIGFFLFWFDYLSDVLIESLKRRSEKEQFFIDTSLCIVAVLLSVAVPLSGFILQVILGGTIDDILVWNLNRHPRAWLNASFLLFFALCMWHVLQWWNHLSHSAFLKKSVDKCA